MRPEIIPALGIGLCEEYAKYLAEDQDELSDIEELFRKMVQDPENAFQHAIREIPHTLDFNEKHLPKEFHNEIRCQLIGAFIMGIILFRNTDPSEEWKWIHSLQRVKARRKKFPFPKLIKGKEES